MPGDEGQQTFPAKSMRPAIRHIWLRRPTLAVGGSFSMPLCPRVASAVAHPDAGDDPLGRDLGERDQHEGALEQMRVGQNQFRIVEDEVVIGEKVDVDRARSPTAFAGTVTAERPFALLVRATSSSCGDERGRQPQ